MENHRPASAAKTIDGAQPCCNEGEKRDRALKGPASSQPHRLQGSLIKRLMGNSIPHHSPKKIALSQIDPAHTHKHMNFQTNYVGCYDLRAINQ